MKQLCAFCTAPPAAFEKGSIRMLLTQEVDEKILSLTRMTGPASITELFETIKALGQLKDKNARSTAQLSKGSMLHIQAEELWHWADAEEVAAWLAEPSNLKELDLRLTKSIALLGFECQQSAQRSLQIWPCIGCNTPYDEGHAHAGVAPPPRASASWSLVRRSRHSCHSSL